MYECYPVDAAFVVESPTWWGFDGTGVRRGDRFEGLVGPEADRVYLNRSTPRPMEVLSHSPYSCRGVHDQRAVRLLHDGLRARASSTPARCGGAVRWSTGASTPSATAPARSWER